MLINYHYLQSKVSWRKLSKKIFRKIKKAFYKLEFPLIMLASWAIEFI